MYGYQYLKEFLQNEGFRFEDLDGLMKFKVEGVIYFAFKNEGPFLQITLTCRCPESATRLQMLDLCNDLNGEKFITKFCLNEDGDRVHCSYELLPHEHMSTDDWMIVFRILDKNSDDLLERMQKM